MTNVRKYLPGDRVQIPASFMNDATDLIRAAKGNRNILKTANNDGSIIMVQNVTGSFQEANAPLVLNGAMVEVDGDGNMTAAVEGKFRRGGFVLCADDPEVGDTAICVLINALRDDEIGPAWVSGVVPVKIDVVSDDDTHVDFGQESGEPVVLESARAGQWPIFWKPPKEEAEETPETLWSLVHIGGGNGGGSYSNPCDQTYEGEHQEAAIDDNNYTADVPDGAGDKEEKEVIWYRNAPDSSSVGPYQGIKLTVSMGAAYYDDGDEKLYQYVADWHIDSSGRILFIEAERRVVVDVPEECP